MVMKREGKLGHWRQIKWKNWRILDPKESLISHMLANCLFCSLSFDRIYQSYFALIVYDHKFSCSSYSLISPNIGSCFSPGWVYLGFLHQIATILKFLNEFPAVLEPILFPLHLHLSSQQYNSVIDILKLSYSTLFHWKCLCTCLGLQALKFIQHLLGMTM